MSKEGLREFSDGEVYFWIEQESSVHIKAVTKFGDPVELTAEEARALAKALLQAAESIDPHR